MVDVPPADVTHCKAVLTTQFPLLVLFPFVVEVATNALAVES